MLPEALVLKQKPQGFFSNVVVATWHGVRFPKTVAIPRVLKEISFYYLNLRRFDFFWRSRTCMYDHGRRCPLASFNGNLIVTGATGSNHWYNVKGHTSITTRSYLERATHLSGWANHLPPMIVFVCCHFVCIIKIFGVYLCKSSTEFYPYCAITQCIFLYCKTLHL